MYYIDPLVNLEFINKHRVYYVIMLEEKGGIPMTPSITGCVRGSYIHSYDGLDWFKKMQTKGKYGLVPNLEEMKTILSPEEFEWQTYDLCC